MFTNRLPDEEDYRVIFSEYAKCHFIKKFAKKYKGQQWLVTQNSIQQDLKRIRLLQSTQQVDELRQNGKFWLFKYDFAVAQTNVSPKSSGNRCLIFLDSSLHLQTVILVYSKNHLPKNQKETTHILQVVRQQFSNFWAKF